MPLSEHEQRLLEEMERSLYQNDADFVTTVSPRAGKANYTVLAIGVLVALLGVGVLITGVVVHQLFVGLLGFAVMFVGVLLAVAPPRRVTAADAERPTAGRGRAKSSSFMDDLNDRWDKRQDGRDR
jgi:hypothetical protein